jgi:predicted porin
LLSSTACAAFAQSSVTIFGKVVMQVAHRDSGTSAAANIPTAVGTSMNGLSSGLGFNGTEDMGGGLKAYFVLEHRFKTQNGTQSATAFWEGKSIVGLSGQYGDVYLGRDYLPAFYPGVKVEPFGYDGSVGSLLGQAWAGYTLGFNSRGSNMLGYKTPSFGGFSARLATSLGEGTAPNTNGANIEYVKGPAYAGIGVSHTNDLNRVTIIAAAYDFGFIRPAAWYSTSRHSGNHGRSIALALTAPVGPGVVKAVYQTFDPDTQSGNLNASAAAGGALRSKLAVGYTYPLSKRTSITPTLAKGKQDLSTLTSTTAYDVVLRHDF